MAAGLARCLSAEVCCQQRSTQAHDGEDGEEEGDGVKVEMFQGKFVHVHKCRRRVGSLREAYIIVYMLSISKGLLCDICITAFSGLSQINC